MMENKDAPNSSRRQQNIAAQEKEKKVSSSAGERELMIAIVPYYYSRAIVLSAIRLSSNHTLEHHLLDSRGSVLTFPSNAKKSRVVTNRVLVSNSPMEDS